MTTNDWQETAQLERAERQAAIVRALGPAAASRAQTNRYPMPRTVSTRAAPIFLRTYRT